MTLVIKEVNNKRDLKNFIRLPWKVYQDYPQWVPPLISEEKKRFNPKKNPFYSHSEVRLFIVLRNDEPAGRISVHIDRNYIELHGENTGHFGFFESINDMEVARLLFDKTKDILKKEGMEGVIGPLSFSTNDEAGLLIEGFEYPPSIMNPYHPPYYRELIEGYGFEKAKDLLAYKITIDEDFLKFAEKVKKRLKPICNRAQKEGFTVRNINLKRFKEEVQKIRDIYNNAWEKNWGFVPMTEDEFQKLASDLKPVVIPELAKIVEFHGKPAGFGLAVPDVNQILRRLNGRLFPFGIFQLLFGLKKIDTVRLLALGIKKEYRKRGVDSLLYHSMLESGLNLKRLRGCEVSWLLEDNYGIIRPTEFMRGVKEKVYRVYYLSL